MTKRFVHILINHWDLLLLFVFILIYSVVFSYLSILRHNAFASGFDLANMSQTVWNTINGRLFVLSGQESTVSRFSIHADALLILLSPFYLIWERARMLLVLQSIFIGLGAIPVYFLAKEVFKKIKDLPDISIKLISLSIVLAYLLNPAIQWTNIYDFHGVSFAMPFILATFYFAYTKSWAFYWLFLTLSLITKEEISLIIGMMGVCLFFLLGEKKRGIMTFLVGISWFVVMTFFVIPYFATTNQHWAWGRYFSHLVEVNQNTPESLKRVVIEDPKTKEYILLQFKFFGFLPLLGLPWLILSLPELLINLLSQNPAMKTIYYHYGSGVQPGLIIATIFGLKYLHFFVSKIETTKKYAKYAVYIAALYLLLIVLRVNYNYSPLPTTPSCWCIMYKVSEEDIRFDEILKALPKEGIVTSSTEIRAHLTLRENSFNLPYATDSAKYIAILDQNRMYGDYNIKEYEAKLVDILFASKKHELIHKSEHFYLFKRKDI